jgi:SAM-dependent methyltransferase
VSPEVEPRNLTKAASCGEPSYVWRAGQARRLQMILDGFGECARGRILENGCGIGMYVRRLQPFAARVVGLEYDYERALAAFQIPAIVVCAAGEAIPFPDTSFDAILSHEVLEHVFDDRHAVREMVRSLRSGGRLVVFVPNRGYPFETHGIYWRGKYRFGNIPLVNWLPRRWRNRLAPHVRVYSRRDLEKLFECLPLKLIDRRIVFGAYDNIIGRWPAAGRFLRLVLQVCERTPLQVFGLSHLWVLEKTDPAP